MTPHLSPLHHKIVLVSIHSAPSPQAVPLANAFLKSAAENIPVEITLIDFFAGQSPAECAQVISRLAPDAVGFSLYVWNCEMCIRIAELLRVSLSETRLFAGGPEVTANPGIILKTGAFDFVISGEGESLFRQLCHRMAAALPIDDIAGLQKPQDSEPPPAQPAAVDLDEIPSPYLTGVIDTKLYSGILWQLSRGCSFSCDFCFDSCGSSGVRRFSLQRLEAELRHFAASGVSQVFVLDSTFNQDAKRAKAILRMIGKIAPRIHFHFEIRSEFIDREMARLFAKLTCSLQIGLQSSDPDVLKRVGRTFYRNDFIARIGLLNESGAVFGFDLIYGLPGDTLRSFYDSLDFALSLYPNHLDIFPLALLRGTALQARSDAIGLVHLPAPPYTLISSPTFSSDDMQKARLITTATDIFYTRGKSVAWFNAVMAVIREKPSDFFRRFAEMMVTPKGSGFCESDVSDNDIWNMQREFLTHTFSVRQLSSFLPLVLDLVDYHFHYAAALLAPQAVVPDSAKRRKSILNIPLRRADSLQMARFHYEILDIIEFGEPDIRAMSKLLKPMGATAIIYPRGNAVCTESIDDSYYRLLESLDGVTAAGDLAIRAGINGDHAVEFLSFALKEGFVV